MPFLQPQDSRPLRIVVADDNKDSAQTMAILLGAWGHNVQPIFTHHDAITTCRAFHPDVLLLDLGLPLRTDGLLVARTVRQDRPADELVIAAVTGHSDEFTRDEAARAGVNHFFVKPLDPEALHRFLAGVHPQRQRWAD
jgi:CheY-like chemotaxis protein